MLKRKKVRGVIVDGILSHDSSTVREAIKSFWGDLLGTECPYDLKALDELLDNHPFHFSDFENHTVDLLKVEKLLLQANHTVQALMKFPSPQKKKKI